MAGTGALGRLNVVVGVDSSEFTNGLTRAQYLAQKFAKETTTGLKSVEAQTRRTADTLKSAGDNFQALGRSIVGVLSVKQVIAYSDAWQGLKNRLALVTHSSSELADATNSVFETAQKTSQEIDTVAGIYQRFAQSAEGLGLSLQNVNSLVETTAKAVAISGASLESAKGALVQFGQGLAAGQLRGQEFNSVVEQIPGLSQAIAKGMGKTIGELRAAANQGELTSEAIIAALEKAADFVDRQFNTRVKTVGQSFQELQNSVTKFFGEAGANTGAAQVLVKTLGLIAGNFDAITSAALIAAGGKLTAVIAAKTKVVYADVSASIASRNAALSKAQALATETQATVAGYAATNAAIVSARTEVLAKMAAARASISEAQASIAAAQAVGAHSAAIRSLAIAQASLVASQARQSALVKELATLGAAQTATTLAQANAVKAAAAAQTALGAAAGVTGGILARTSALIGGPIGAITLALTAGVTAWQLWGNSATEEATTVAKTTEKSTQDILTSLDSQIIKLRERNEAMAGGDQAQRAGKAISPDVIGRLKTLGSQFGAAQNATGQFAGLPQSVRDILSSQFKAELDQITAKLKDLSTEQGILEQHTRDSKLAELWIKYGDGVEKAADKIREAEKILGGPIPDDLRKAIMDKFNKSPAATGLSDRNKALEAGQKEIDQLREQLSTINAITEAEKLSAKISSGNSALATDGQRQVAMAIAQTIDLRKQESAVIQEQQAELDDLIAAALKREDRLNELTGRADAFQQQTDIKLLSDRFNAGDISFDEFNKGIDAATKNSETKFGDMSNFAVQAARSMQMSLGSQLSDVLKGNFDNIGLNFASMLADMAAQAAASHILESILGFGVGGRPSGIGEFFSALLPGKAVGGPTQPGGLYPVNERGPELLTSGGKTYLMNGNQAGFVTPLSSGTPATGGADRSNSVNVSTNIVFQNGSMSSSSTQGDTASKGRDLARTIEDSVKATISRETRQGGIIWNLAQGRR